ncbi:MAG: hypothetical protein CMH30_07790 [Micavibrio sp.]|nr:hypothetical protein [Micavibrio sp.]
MYDLDELRQEWSAVWGLPASEHISRDMLERSLHFKKYVEPNIDKFLRSRLAQLVSDFKRDKGQVSAKRTTLKVGTKLIRNWQGTDHIVTVIDGGFEYQGQRYKSLSKIANEITGSRWNGWLFFGFRK